MMKTSCWFLLFCFERGAGGAFFNRGVYWSELVGCAVAQFFGGDTASEIHFKKFATFLRNTWCVLLRIVFLEIMGDSGESTTSSTRKRKRVKLKCLVSHVSLDQSDENLFWRIMLSDLRRRLFPTIFCPIRYSKNLGTGRVGRNITWPFFQGHMLKFSPIFPI